MSSTPAICFLLRVLHRPRHLARVRWTLGQTRNHSASACVTDKHFQRGGGGGGEFDAPAACLHRMVFARTATAASALNPARARIDQAGRGAVMSLDFPQPKSRLDALLITSFAGQDKQGQKRLPKPLTSTSTHAHSHHHLPSHPHTLTPAAHTHTHPHPRARLATRFLPS